jgi:hypothetical protein
MAITFTTTQANAVGLDLEKYLLEKPVRVARYKEPTLLDFALAPIDNAFVKLERGAYVRLSSSLFPNWFTGYVVNDPELSFLGKKDGQAVWGYKYQATSDEYLLNLKPLGNIPPFLNTTMGAVLRWLVAYLVPDGTFDTTGVLDGPSIAQYVVDPESKFLDVVREFCEAAAYTFRGVNKGLHFRPQDSVTSTITLDGTNKHFTPARLTIRPSSTPVVNDVTVLGDIEPQAYVHEYFVGTGLDSAFPLVSSVYGLDSTVLLDEMFSGGAINGTLWEVPTGSGQYLQVDGGYLNINGGSTYATGMRSTNPIPLDGHLRMTHGEWHFISGEGIVGGLWSGEPSTISGCLFGLKITGTTLRPVVAGVLDNNQSVTIDPEKRYVLRTVVEFTKTSRHEQTYAYVGQDGTRATIGGAVDSTRAQWQTIITEVNPTDGKITNQFWFRNESTVSVGYAKYHPVATLSMNATVTAITVSTPVHATLETAHKAPIVNASFEEWVDDQQPFGWKHYVGAHKESVHSNSGNSLKLQALDDPAGQAWVMQAVNGLFESGRAYTMMVRVRKTNSTTAAGGYLRFVLRGSEEGSTFVTDGITIDQSQTSSAGFTTHTGVIYDGSAPLPEKVDLAVELHGGVAVSTAFYIDDIVCVSAYRQEMVGPNELDAVDGLAPIATIAGGNNGEQTKSSASGAGQFNAGQSQLVFFKDSTTRTSNIPPTDQVVRLSYRSAGPAAGRSLDRASILSESVRWGDNGLRSVIRKDITPRPRNSKECEYAAAAIVKESAFQHYEGTYTQYSTYVTPEPVPGYILKFQNLSSMAPVQAEEIQEVSTVLESKSQELFAHTITFGSRDYARQLLAALGTEKGYFQKSNSPSSDLVPVEAAAVSGTVYAPDVVKPTLLWWDTVGVYIDAGQDLGTGEYFEVRYTDSGWGVDDGTNLVARSTSRTISVPRNSRGRTVFIRQVNKGNRVKYSEDLTQSNYTGASSVTKSLRKNPDGDYADVCQVNMLANVPFTVSCPDASGSGACFSFSINGPVGKVVTAAFGGQTKTVTFTGNWQRVSVGGSVATTATITATTNTQALITKVSVETGTTVEKMYCRTTDTLYGPLSRYSGVLHAGFPSEETATMPELEVPGDVTLGTPHRDWEWVDNEWYQVFTIPVTPPDPIGTFDRMFVTLNAPDTDVTTNRAAVSVSFEGFVVGDASVASQVVNTPEPVWKSEVMWDSKDPVLRVKHPAPPLPQKWRITVTSGSPNGTGKTPASVVVDAEPRPNGPSGTEYAPMVTDFDGDYEYFTDQGTGRRGLRIWTGWNKPDKTDPRLYLGVRLEYKRADQPENGWVPNGGLQADEDHQFELFDLPAGDTLFELRALSVGQGGTNTFVQGWSPYDSFTVPAPSDVVPVDNVTGFSVTSEYLTVGNSRVLYIYPQFTSTDPSFAFIEFWAKRGDSGTWHLLGYPSTTGEPGKAWLTEEMFPKVAAEWEFRAVAQDKDSLDRNGNVTTTPPNWPDGTPSFLLTIEPPHVEAPVGQVTGFSVTAEYKDGGGYDGKVVLELTPIFTKPVDDTFWYIQFWAKRGDSGTWHQLNNPGESGDKAIIEPAHLPKVAGTWEFRAVAINRRGETSDGRVDITVPSFGQPTWPTGTPSFSLAIQPPNVAKPVENVTMDPGQPVVWLYAGSDYYGKEELLFWVNFETPTDPSFQYAEIWMFYYPEGRWRVLGYPSEGGSTSSPASLKHAYNVTRLPTSTTQAKFAVVAYDSSGRNRSGDKEVIFPLYTDVQNANFNGWPDGTPVTVVTDITPPTSKMQGNRIANIDVASFAAGLTGTYLVGSLPALPDSKYPVGTPLVLAPGGGVTPKVYRVNAAGNAWTAEVDGVDLVAQSVIAGKIAAGAVGSLEMATTELLVGPAPVGISRCPRFAVRDTGSTLLAMIGEVKTSEGYPLDFQGAYFRNVMIAPGIASTDKYFKCDGTSLKLVGGEVELNYNGFTTYINNADSAGVKVQLNGSQARTHIQYNGVRILDASGVTKMSLDTTGLSYTGSGGVFQVTSDGAGYFGTLSVNTALNIGATAFRPTISMGSYTLSSAIGWIYVYNGAGGYVGRIPITG